ncbi:MAG TPA: hypothetical protein DC054_10905 [Blastocatellia bacterium]|nr:hypothetical protein [Blastocatellia bacterium]
MANNLSKTQIDRLGDRLRKGEITEADLRLLDEYRRSFHEAYEFVVEAVRNDLGLEPTGRPAKSTTSITEKLLRESIRLTQVQDIAGCRLIAPGILEQDRAVSSLTKLFESVSVADRRISPSNGYRAIHVIVTYEEKVVEIQVRTSLQHVWAELSEKMSDVFDPAIKYGGGQDSLRKLLLTWSDVIGTEENIEQALGDTQLRIDSLLSQEALSEDDQTELLQLQREVLTQLEKQATRREGNLTAIREAIQSLGRVQRAGELNDISN